MILYSGRAKDYNFKVLLHTVFWKLARPIEQLETSDFSRN